MGSAFKIAGGCAGVLGVAVLVIAASHAKSHSDSKIGVLTAAEMARITGGNGEGGGCALTPVDDCKLPDECVKAISYGGFQPSCPATGEKYVWPDTAGLRFRSEHQDLLPRLHDLLESGEMHFGSVCQ